MAEMGPTGAAGRALRVGIQLPEVEYEATWPQLRTMATLAEDAGFDSLWVGDHLLYRRPGEPARGPWECWSILAALAAVTRRITLGPLVACTSFHNPALLAKKAATVDEVSGGRLVLGLGAGWNEVEYRAFGFPYDRRVSRFEEAFTIIRSLLRDGAVDFAGEFYQVRDCELLPRPRPGGPPLLIGSNGERMLTIALPHVSAWNTWFEATANRPDGIRGLRERVDAIARTVGREPAEIERSAAVLVRLPDARGRRQGPTAEPGPAPLEGPTEVIAEALLAYRREGVDHVQLVLDPITPASIEAVAPILELLEPA